MLYDFHQTQNASKPGSIHATYLIHGFKDDSTRNGNGDVEMSSSPPEDDSYSEEVSTTTLELVREEQLEGMGCNYSGSPHIN